MSLSSRQSARSNTAPGASRRPGRAHQASPVAQHPLLARQSALGNQAVQRLLASGAIQPKMSVNAPNDRFEHEADRVADQVIRMPDSALQRQPEDDEQVQASSLADDITPLVQRQSQAEEEELQTSALTDGNATLLRRQPAEEEEETLQTMANSPLSTTPLQRQAADTEEEELQASRLSGPATSLLQRQAEEEDEEVVQTKAESAGATPVVSPALESRLNQSHGAGSALDADTRSFLEPRFGRDFSGVRVHTDSTAADSARELNAAAFTRDQDIYFGAGRYQPHTEQGRRLLAHELTHTVQQRPAPAGRPSTQRPASSTMQRTEEAVKPRTSPPLPSIPPVAVPPIQREDDGDADSAQAEPPGLISENVYSLNGITINNDNNTMTIPDIDLPNVRGQPKGALGSPVVSSPLRVPKISEREGRNTSQWDEQGMQAAGLDAKLTEKLKDAPGILDGGQHVYFLRPRGAPDQIVIGPRETIKARVVRPRWNKSGGFSQYDRDHITELQLGGHDDPQSNYELLDPSANRSSGSNINNELKRRVRNALEAAKGALYDKAPDTDEALEKYRITFTNVTSSLPIAGDPSNFWSRDEVWTQGLPLEQLDVLNEDQITEMKLRGTPDTLVIYTNPGGGGRREIEWEEGITEKDVTENSFYPGFHLRHVSYTKEGGGQLSGVIYQDHRYIEEKPLTFEIQKVPGLEFGGAVSRSSVSRAVSQLRAKLMSPVEISDAELVDGVGLEAHGVITADLPFIRGSTIDLNLSGESVELSKTFSAGEIQIPGPIEVTGSSLTITAGTSGLAITGEATFEIPRVGDGRIGAAADSGGEFKLAGEFNFDSNLFDPAKIEVTYADGVFGAAGELGIREGTVTGVKSATINASYSEGVLSASGNAELDVPGVEQGSMNATYSDAEGFSIGGAFQLSGDIPGIRGGSIEAQVTQQGEEGYSVTASGTATPDIPGVDASISVGYDDGAITIEGAAGYARGPVSGTITVGATNRPVDEEGRPGGEPTDRLTAYGGGTVTATITPWLQASIGMKILPNGQVEISGSVGLPDVVELFPEKSYDKNIFTVGLDIPIVGVAVAGQRIGIFLNISGGLDLSAGIGPGQLRELGLTVTFNPDQPEATTIAGGAQLHVPAHAGLRLFIRGALGAGIPVVSASAGLEVGGQLGVEGALQAGVDVNWTPTTGLSIDAEAEIFAQPAFRFDITGFVMVEADLLFTTIELYSKRWELAAFEFGSDLRFGMTLPIHYVEGQPFNLSLSDIEFEVPDIDPGQLLSGLFDRIT